MVEVRFKLRPNLNCLACSSTWPPPASQVVTKPLTVLSVITVAAAESFLTHHTSQITSEWQRPDWTAGLIQVEDHLRGFNITEKIILGTGVGWQNSLSSRLRP